MPYSKPFELPPEFQDFTSDQLIAELPYAWQPSLRTELVHGAIMRRARSDNTVMQRASDAAKRHIMPPIVARAVDGLLNWLTPEVIKLVHDSTDVDAARSFEVECLNLAAGSSNEGNRPYVHSAGITVPGHYPLVNLAAAISTEPERFKRHTAQYAGQMALLLRSDRHLAQLAVIGQPGEEEIIVGNVWKMSDIGKTLVEHTLGLLEDNVDLRNEPKV